MGSYAQYVAVKALAIARKPSNLSFEEAASVPVASQTAWQAIFTHGRLEKGQTILIHGGAGAVGAYAVQLASHAGAPSSPPQVAAMRRVSGVMMRLEPSGEMLGRIGRLLEEDILRPDVATVYALEDAAQAWKDIARNLPVRAVQ